MSKARGIASYENLSSDFNILSFIIENAVKGLVNTSLVVTVTEVDAANLKVTVKPLIAQRDGENNKVDLPTIFDIPYMRSQAGDTAIIIDPKVGDIGIMICFQQDSSSLKQADTTQVLPATFTAYPLYSGVYLGGILNKEPKTIIELKDDFVTITADNVTVNSKTITMGDTAKVEVIDNTVTVTATTAEVNATNISLGENATNLIVNNGLTTLLDAHVHTSSAPGSPSSPPVVPFKPQEGLFTNANIKIKGV